ncbi:hypothetical protein NQZ68_020948 [Dissostichus eleginoides]|nr:hypothetical protein NQZ68_020948 [Dissostichus eleginoides]
MEIVGSYLWGYPRKVGTPYVDENNENAFAGTRLGRSYFAKQKDMKTREFLKGGSVAFVFSFQGRLRKYLYHPASHWKCPAKSSSGTSGDQISSERSEWRPLLITNLTNHHPLNSQNNG